MCASLFSTSVAAEKLKVIAEVGETISTSGYFSLISIEEAGSAFQVDLSNYQKNFTKDAFFPLSTTMSPGRLDSLEFTDPKRLVRPFVVVGQDELSVEWLQFRYQELVEMQALVFVVEADSFDYLRELGTRFSPLRIAPANGDAIGKSLNVMTYPFMVNQYGVWQ